METLNRRNAILKQLKSETKPIKGSELARTFGVSRQVIVQDIALLRAGGVNIVATPAGYIVQVSVPQGLLKTIHCQHSEELDEIKQELEIIINQGGKVIDVVVEHPVYGEIRAVLGLKSLKDVEQFIERVKKHQTKPLSLLTEGSHYHTLEVGCESMFRKIIEELTVHHFLKRSDKTPRV